MKFSVVFRWLAVCSLVAACTPDTPTATRTTAPTIEVIRPPVLRDEARPPAADSALTNVVVREDGLVFTYSSPPASPPAVGEVVAGVEEGGYLRRIVEVRDLGSNRYELITEPAYLTDYFADLHVRLAFEPPAGAWTETAGVGGRSDALGGSMNLIKTEVAPGCDLESGAVEVGADFEPRFEMDIDISFWDGLKEFRFEVGGDITIFTKLSTGRGALSCSWDRRFESLQREFTSTFAIGFVPVIVTHTIVPRGKYSLGGEVDVPRVEFEVSGSLGFTGGAIYEDEHWTPVADGRRSGSADFTIEEGGHVEVTTRLTAGINYQAKIYDLAGPQMDIGPYAEGHAESNLCEWSANADLGLQMTIGARLDVPVFDISLVDYSSDALDLVSGTFWMRDGTWPWCADAGPDAGMSVDGGTAPDASADPCASHTGCDECTGAPDDSCSWCAGTGCMSDSRRSECGGEWQDSRASCVDCSVHTSCGDCVPDGYCGWCPGMGCLNDDSEEAVSCGGYQPSTCG